MKRLLSISAFLLPICIFAQGFGSFSHDQPYFAKDAAAGGGEPGTNILTLYTNLYLWWVASDVPVGHVVSNQWLDRIQGRLMGQGNATYQPTNTTNGVYFDGAHYLTNIPVALGASGSRPLCLFVWQLAHNAATQNVWRNNNSPNTGGIQLLSSDALRNIDGVFGARDSFPNMTGRLMDVLIHEMDYWTNSATNRIHAGINQGSGMGWQFLGTDPSIAGFTVNAYIREIILWTNTGISAPLDYSVRSNLHYYVTNKYLFSP